MNARKPEARRGFHRRRPTREDAAPPATRHNHAHDRVEHQQRRRDRRRHELAPDPGRRAVTARPPDGGQQREQQRVADSGRRSATAGGRRRSREPEQIDRPRARRTRRVANTRAARVQTRGRDAIPTDRAAVDVARPSRPAELAECRPKIELRQQLGSAPWRASAPRRDRANRRSKRRAPCPRRACVVRLAALRQALESRARSPESSAGCECGPPSAQHGVVGDLVTAWQGDRTGDRGDVRGYASPG